MDLLDNANSEGEGLAQPQHGTGGMGLGLSADARWVWALPLIALIAGLAALFTLPGARPAEILSGTLGLWAGALAVVVAALALARLLWSAIGPKAAAVSAFHRLYGSPGSLAAITTPEGAVLAISPDLAAASDGPVAHITDCAFAAWMPAPAQDIYHLARTARADGIAALRLSDRGQPRMLSVRAAPGDLMIWQIDSAPPRAEGGMLPQRLALLRLSRAGRIVEASPAARAMLPDGAQTVAECFALPMPDAFGLVTLAHGGHALLCRLPQPASPGADSTSPPSLSDEEMILLLPASGAAVPASTVGDVTELFLEGLPVALARLKPDGTILAVNACARKLLGPGAVPGINLTTLLVGLGRPLPEQLSDAVKGRLRGRAEMAQSSQEDTDVFLQVSLVLHEHFEEPNILAVFSDATELKTLEAQFVQSQKMQAVGQLAGGVAHDFNNLLTAIRGHCDLLLLRHEAGDADNGDLMQIRQNANRAAALVRQLLAFSRKQTLRPRILHLYDTLSELTHLLNRLLGEKVTLRVENAQNLWPVRVDERQFEQVVMNLVVNARDAMPKGGTVSIRTSNLKLREDLTRDRATVPHGRYVAIEVEDSGVGIQPDKVAKIFEPFYTTKRVGEGTGLGLSTAYGIIKQTGGFIFCDSTLGDGTTFRILLPAHEGKTNEVEGEEAGAQKDARPRDLTGQGVVLLVEDEAPVRSFAARALQLRGYTVLEAGSGEEALEILSDPDRHIDLFVSDVIMPGLDGPSWVREAHKTRPGIATVFVSGYAEDAFDKSRGEIPNATFLAKPFSLNELTERVKVQMHL